VWPRDGVSILLLVIAVICWAVAAVPGFISIGIGRVDWGWLGLLFFGLWLLIGGSGQLLAFVQRPHPRA
jgi:hypothetical protein